MGAYILYWLIFANCISFGQMIYDKHLAERSRPRISEARLLGWMSFGGAPGGLLASRLVRHKTRKQPFASRMIVRAVFWTVVGTLWFTGYLEPLVLWLTGYLEPMVMRGLAILAQRT